MDIQEGSTWMWALVTLVIFGAVGALVIGELQGTYTENSTEYNVTVYGITGLANFVKQLPTVGIIMGVMLIIGAVVMIAVYFGKKEGM